MQQLCRKYYSECRNSLVEILETLMYGIISSLNNDVLTPSFNLREEKVGDSLECIHTEDNYMSTMQIVQALRSTVNE